MIRGVALSAAQMRKLEVEASARERPTKRAKTIVRSPEHTAQLVRIDDAHDGRDDVGVEA